MQHKFIFLLAFAAISCSKNQEVIPIKNYQEKCVIQQDTKLNYGSVTTDEIYEFDEFLNKTKYTFINSAGTAYIYTYQNTYEGIQIKESIISYQGTESGKIVYEHHPTGELLRTTETKLNDVDFLLIQEFDVEGRLTKEVEQDAASLSEQIHAYEGENEILYHFLYNGESAFKYETFFRPDGQISHVIYTSNNLGESQTTYIYDDSGLLAEIKRNGESDVYIYDSNNILQKKVNVLRLYTTTFNTYTKYEYNAKGQVVKEYESKKDENSYRLKEGYEYHESGTVSRHDSYSQTGDLYLMKSSFWNENNKYMGVKYWDKDGTLRSQRAMKYLCTDVEVGNVN